MIMNRIFLGCVALASLTGVVHAQSADATSLGKFEAWEAFTYQASDSKVCYVFAAPAKSEASKKVRRSEIYFMVTNWPGKKVKGQPSTIIGYPFKEGSDVLLAVGDKSFSLYPVDDMAWTDKLETEKSILTALKGGKAMTIKGMSARGTETTDTYSLAGLKAALAAIDSACK